MIERKFIRENMMEHEIREFIENQLDNAGLSEVTYQQTPLGEKIVIFASRPGLVVGRGGSNITELTRKLKENFDLENPQVEIEEVEEPHLDPNIIAERIANNLERFGPTRFKGIGYRALNDVMDAGARGVEIIISGRIPGSMARNWRFYAGYLKKCGHASMSDVKSGFHLAVIKAGSVGIKVRIMPPDARLPDDIEIHEPGIEKTDEEATSEGESVETDDEEAETGADEDPVEESKDTKKEQDSGEES